MTLDEVARLHGTNRKRLSKLFQQYNFTIRDASHSHRKHIVDENYFEKIDTEEKAYWLGFLYADGSISIDDEIGRYVLSLALAQKDEDHVVKFAKALNADYAITQSSHKTSSYKTSYSSRISIPNKKLVLDLNKAGCIPNKTFKVKFPDEDILPIKLWKHFIRGVFDGDGCITYSTNNERNYSFTFSMVGTCELMNGICDALIKEEVIQRKPIVILINGQKIYKFDIYGKYNILCLMDYLYSDATIYLDRKRQKFLEIIELPGNSVYPRYHIKDKKCEICGDKNSIRYITIHNQDSEYNGKVLCNKHYIQIEKFGKPIDDQPYSKSEIYCVNTGMVFHDKKSAAEWAGLHSSYGITKCINGTQVASGHHPETGELLRWCEYNEDKIKSIDINKELDYTNIYSRIRERPIFMIDIDSNEIISKFKSSSEAGAFLKKKNHSNITSCCKGRRPSAFGYKWAYVDSYKEDGNALVL